MGFCGTNQPINPDNTEHVIKRIRRSIVRRRLVFHQQLRKLTAFIAWMDNNLLELNLTKIEIKFYSSEQKAEDLHYKAEWLTRNVEVSARKLGIILDNTLELEKQLNVICNSCYQQTRRIQFVYGLR